MDDKRVSEKFEGGTLTHSGISDDAPLRQWRFDGVRDVESAFDFMVGLMRGDWRADPDSMAEATEAVVAHLYVDKFLAAAGNVDVTPEDIERMRPLIVDAAIVSTADLLRKGVRFSYYEPGLIEEVPVAVLAVHERISKDPDVFNPEPILLAGRDPEVAS